MNPQQRLGQQLMRHTQVLHRVKQRLHAKGGVGLEPGASALLVMLAKIGPQRQGDLAESSLLTPSTVSRHVGQLLKAGLVVRVADETDGRAILLRLSEEGAKVAERLVQARGAIFKDVLSGWSERDIDALTDLLERLNNDMEIYIPKEME